MVALRSVPIRSCNRRQVSFSVGIRNITGTVLGYSGQTIVMIIKLIGYRCQGAALNLAHPSPGIGGRLRRNTKTVFRCDHISSVTAEGGK